LAIIAEAARGFARSIALAAPGLKIIQLQVIFYEHLPKKENNVFPMNAVFLALSVFVVIGRFSLFR